MNKQTQEALKMVSLYMTKNTLTGEERHMILRACKEALEQPAQEPVAWISESTLKHSAEYRNRFDDAKSWAEIRAVDRKTTNCDVPLYTHPHQWQGLTDDEIDALEHNDFTCWGRDDLIVFGRAIEQALKEKNT